MPTLQIRDLPEHLHRLLAEKAKRHRRSLAQQAVVELEHMVEAETRLRRQEVIRALRERVEREGTAATSLHPVDVVREDRDR